MTTSKLSAPRAGDDPSNKALRMVVNTMGDSTTVQDICWSHLGLLHLNLRHSLFRMKRRHLAVSRHCNPIMAIGKSPLSR